MLRPSMLGRTHYGTNSWNHSLNKQRTTERLTESLWGDTSRFAEEVVQFLHLLEGLTSKVSSGLGESV